MLYQKQYLHLHTFCFYKKHYKKKHHKNSHDSRILHIVPNLFKSFPLCTISKVFVIMHL